MARRRRKSNPRRRRNKGFMKMMKKPAPLVGGLGLSVAAIALIAAAWNKDAIMAWYADQMSDKAGLGALAFNNNPLHMGALAFNALDFSGAEGVGGQHGFQGQHSYGALAFNNPRRRMGRR